MLRSDMEKLVGFGFVAFFHYGNGGMPSRIVTVRVDASCYSTLESPCGATPLRLLRLVDASLHAPNFTVLIKSSSLVSRPPRDVAEDGECLQVLTSCRGGSSCTFITRGARYDAA